MSITIREFWAVFHGMIVGAIYLLAFAGGFAGLWSLKRWALTDSGLRERMKRLARKRGSVVAIGHPYAATLELLERELPKLAAEGIELVTISALVRRQ